MVLGVLDTRKEPVDGSKRYKEERQHGGRTQYTVPKAVEAYLSQQDLSCLKVYLILTHGGGGKGSVPADLSAMLRGAVLDENILLIYDDDADEAAGKVYEWLKTID